MSPSWRRLGWLQRRLTFARLLHSLAKSPAAARITSASNPRARAAPYDWWEVCLPMTGQQMPSLTAKLQQRQREQLAEVERLTSEQLQQLAATLRQQCSAALSTTSSDIDQTLSALQYELRTTKEVLQRTLSEARNTAERSLLSHMEQEQLKKQLHDQLSQVHSEAMAGQLTPLRRELQAINREAQNLSRTTFRAWLKPLLIGGSVAIGAILAAVAGTLTLDGVIASRAATLSDLQSQIADQQMTLRRMQGSTWGIDLQMIEGQQYLVLPEGRTIDGRSWTVGGRQALKLMQE